MNIYMIIISVDFDNARKVCETIENMNFDTFQDVAKYLNKHDIDKANIITISDYMDAVNDQYLDNMTESFISYVTIGK